QLVSDLDDYRHLLEHARVDAIDMFLTERNATLDIDLARFRVDDVPSYDRTFHSGTICGRHFDIFGRVEGSNDLRIGGIGRVHRSQQSHGRELTALVNAHAECIFLGDVDFDPAAALGNDSATVKLPLAGFRLNHEIDARRAM